MGIHLVVEVLEHAPAVLSSAERIVLVVLAEKADDTTRECWPKDELVARRAGLAVESLTNVFRRLAAHGLEVRIPIGYTAGGRPLFACNGRQKSYRIPRLTPGSSVGGPVFKPGRRTELEAEDRSADTGRPVAEHLKTGPPTGPIPQEPSLNPQQQAAAAAVMEKTDANASVAADVVARVEAERRAAGHPVRRPAAFFAALDRRDLQPHVDAVRADRATAKAATAPDCPVHRGSPAHNCGPCRSEQLGVA